jgi:Cysteine dioxygenase type I
MTTLATTGVRRTVAGHLATARRYAARPHDWPLAPRFDPHQRWYHRLATERDAEVWLLTWLPGQGTDLHDHGGTRADGKTSTGLPNEPHRTTVISSWRRSETTAASSSRHHS